LRKPGLVLLVLVLAAGSAVGLAACGGSSGKEGGTLTGTYASFPAYLDPALSYEVEGWTAMYDTYLPLLTYAHANGAEGSKVVPALAESMPKITDGGKTYTLTLRKGLKYSDGTPVKASDFKVSIERMFKLNSAGSGFYEGIVGAEKFAETKSGGISGIKVDDKTGKIEIDLTAPRGTFTNELGLLYAAVLPASTPVKNMTADPPPATGPYMLTEVETGRGWSYARNPYWAKDNSQISEVPGGHVDKIEIKVVHNDSTQVNEIERNKTNWMQTPISADLYNKVKDKYEGTQFRVERPINIYIFWMNTEKAPFDDLKVREAVNYAVNTAALEKIYAGSLVALHQILPEGMPGHEPPFDLYPYNMAKAKQLIKEANPSDRDITVWTDNESPNDEAGEYLEGVLDELGFNAKLKVLNGGNYYTVVGNESTPDLDTGWLAFYQDYPHPNDFLQLLFSGESIAPTSNTNLSRIDVPSLNAKITKLGEEPLGSKQEDEYATLDKELMEEAPIVPYGTNTVSTFVDSEIDLDKVIFNPTFGQDLTSFQFK
jgi:peptide/nickel transport system substrate-binding protein